MLGTHHHQLLEWLAGPWRSGNKPVCVVEGFSGVGKTEVADELEMRVPGTIRADAPASGDLQDLLLTLGQALAPSHAELAIAINEGRPLDVAFEGVLAKPVLIILDEAQQMLDPEQPEPRKPLATLLERLSRKPALRGRLLLLTHRSLDKTRRWGERIAFKTLPGLSPEEGARLLGELLSARGRESDVPPGKRQEVSRWLGGNPRALRVLVGCLDQDPLETLTGVVPEAWEARDQDVSERLLASLERELLRRAMDRLDPTIAAALECVSVYRTGVKRDGLQRQLPVGLTMDRFLDATTSRFLLEQRSGFHALNPVVRELALHRLKANPEATLIAHRSAAGHYTRHFTGKQIVNPGALGGAFIEARYHLVQAGDEAQLAPIAMRYGEHLRSLYGWTARPAADPEERDEQISVLSAFLQDGGPKGMAYYLARLLSARGRPGDRRRALEHARRGTGRESPAAAWVLRIRLEAEEEGPASMLRAARQGFQAVHADQDLSSLYQSAGELLSRAGRNNEALALLREGLGKIPPEKSLVSLYQSAGELLGRAGRIDEAVALLREGLGRIPPEKNLFSLYQSAGELLSRAGRIDEALALLREGFGRTPPEKNLFSLYQAGGYLLSRADRTDEAVALLREGIARIPVGQFGRLRLFEAAFYLGAAIRDLALLAALAGGHGSDVCESQGILLSEVLRCGLRDDWLSAALCAYHGGQKHSTYIHLRVQEIFAWECAGDHERAKQCFVGFPFRAEKGAAHSWLLALVAIQGRELLAARESISTYLGRPLAPDEQPSLEWILRFWHESIDATDDNRPAYIFPNLPPTITGGRGWIRRFPRPSMEIPAPLNASSPAQITMASITPSASHSPATVSAPRRPRNILAVATEWESRHGGLSTFNRDLCTALASAGHRVVCVVPDIQTGEEAKAKSSGVHLLSPPAHPGLVGTEALLLDTRLPEDFQPDLVLGHDRKTGPHAAALARKLPGAHRVHFVHTRPEDIEWHKDKLGEDDAATKAEERRLLQGKLAESAALVVGVGPALFKAASSLVFLASPRPPVHRLDPGFHPVARPADLPPEIHCLVLGRAEDSLLKGLDIAARSLGEVARRGKVPSPPRMIVRGAPAGTGAELRRRLVEIAAARLDIEVREYSPDVERLQHDILHSSLVLMPSRSEGFGLVGLEAIAAGTPVLVSDRSGLAELLRERLGKDAEAMVVETHETLEKAAPEWDRQIEAVLLDRPAAFHRAAAVRDKLSETLTWKNAVTNLEIAWEPLFEGRQPSTPTR